MSATIPHYVLYGEENPVNELEFVHIEAIADRRRLHQGEVRPHRHDNLHQMLLLERGHMGVHVDTLNEHLYGPAIMSLPPTVVHGFDVDPGVQGYVLTIADHFLHQLIDDFLLVRVHGRSLHG